MYKMLSKFRILKIYPDASNHFLKHYQGTWGVWQLYSACIVLYIRACSQVKKVHSL